ncbi:hypothetical protein RNJ44_02245 [Nakaseomyces bracarensis]|uniref:Lunapark zinc ribbon domain-containing protein n=1 Tax=Nakaseomyces bracarensis TaxID=273131 RepID=A0ABR4NMY4_9SACH
MLWFSKKSLVQRYTADLSQITQQIHELDKSIKNRQAKVDRLQGQITYLGITATMVVMAYVHLEYGNMLLSCGSGVGSIFVLVLFKWFMYRLYAKYHQYKLRRLARLRGEHQKKLDKLKEETNFNATHSIIQRFSSGETQSEDAVILMDEEISKKYGELNELQKQLTELKQNEAKLKDPKERDVWFDKVLGVLSGGDEMAPRPIICPQCSEHTGAYRLVNRPLRYVCPNCSFKIEEKVEEEVVEEKEMK